jgi:AcrR family transcriptional regulator
MPRHVDQDDRRAEILRATLEILAERGPQGLTFRAVAGRMGGSSTLVTHYFASRQALLDNLAAEVANWPTEVAELEVGVDDPSERLRLFLHWLVPSDEEGMIKERGRMNMIGEWDTRVRTHHLFDTWDQHVRDHLRRHVESLVPRRSVEATVDLLRSITNGITLSAVEHPADWPQKRQFAVIDDALDRLGLAPAPARRRRARAKS